MANEKHLHGHQLVDELGVKGLPLKVEYTYYPGLPATDDEPPTYDEVEVDAVWVDGIDILLLIGDKTLNLIIEELYKIIDKRKEES